MYRTFPECVGLGDTSHTASRTRTDVVLCENYESPPFGLKTPRLRSIACRTRRVPSRLRSLLCLLSKKSILRILHLSLTASCQCGAKFQAPPNLAGKQVACPSCGQALVVPSAAPAQAAGKIAVACQCGKRFAAPPNLAGRQVQVGRASCRERVEISVVAGPVD